MKKIGILGATGEIGKRYLSVLEGHPWFEISFLAASTASKGPHYKDFPLLSLKDIQAQSCDLLFSALPNPLALEIEPELARQGFKIISSAPAHRQNPDVPLLIPEINAHHLNTLPSSGGYIVAKPNCTLQTFMLPLAPLHKKFQIQSLIVTSLQATSGAGKSGLQKSAIEDNVIPYIAHEEEKLETEPFKIWEGSYFPITAHCNRVPVSNGHLVCVSVAFKNKPTRDQILETWMNPSPLSLPFAPKFPVVYHEGADRPQPSLDRDKERGMCVTVGRLRECSVLDWRFVALSHNLVRGGAGGGLLCAELLYQTGRL